MTPRQRILAALNHEQPDRVPIDFGSHRSSGIAAIAYRKLRKALGLPERTVRVYDPIQQLAIIDEDVLDRFGADAIELGRGYALDDRDWADWTLPDGSACQMPAWALPEREPDGWVIRSQTSGRALAKMPDGDLYFQQCHWPYLENDDFDRLPEALAESMWGGIPTPPGPLASGPDGPRRLAEGAKTLRARTDRAIVGLFGGSLLEAGQFLYRNDNFLMLLAADPGRASEFLQRLVEIHLANLEAYLAAVGPYIDIIVFVDDLGMQSGPQMSRAMYRDLFMPRHARMWKRAKELADVKVMLHSCGGIRSLLPDLIEAGLDAVNPVQITCVGMDAAGLKADFGDRIAFWGGGCDARFMSGKTRPEEIREHVCRQVEILNGGGFVFQPTQNILADAPPENVIAMYDVVRWRETMRQRTMTPDEFINESIAVGQRDGIQALNADQRSVFLVSEAECMCDIDGIESFLEQYAEWISETAAAFEAVGGVEIAAELRAAPLSFSVGDSRLDHLNELICRRVGYDYDAIARVVDSRRRTC